MTKNLLSNDRLLRQELKVKRTGYSRIAGVDEAGRGPLAGPVVAASVILISHDFSVRLDDSKALSASQREAAYDQICQKAIIGIGIVSAQTIDTINIRRATMRAMEISILDLGIEPDFILIDGIDKLRFKKKQRCVIDGDRLFLSIACASIVAKVTRDKLLSFYDGLFPNYGFARHKGYGTRRHIDAIERCGPSPIHRRSFNRVRTYTEVYA